MRETIRLSVRLLLFALIAALALAATNEITKGPIAEQAKNKANAAREQVLPGADSYDPMELVDSDQYPGIDALHRVLKDGQTTGYTFLVSSSGYKGLIVMTLAVNQSGSINSLVINSQSETAGLGSKVAEQDFLSQFAGKAADPDQIASNVDAISGATVSSKAVISGVEQALRYARDVLNLPAQAGEVITREDGEQYKALEEQTGAKEIRSLSAFAAIGFPDIVQVYSVEYDNQEGYLIELTGGQVILSDSGELLFPEAAGDAPLVNTALDYYEKYLKQGGTGA